MKINFSKTEYRLLVEMLEIADWVMHAHDDEEREDTAAYRELRNKLFAFAEEMGMEDYIVYDEEEDMYLETARFEEEGEYMEFIEQFEEDVFWNKLVSKLAERDFLEQHRQSPMSQEETMQRLSELDDFYRDELDRNGLSNLRLLPSGQNIVH